MEYCCMVPGKIYHVYNHANGWENLFSEGRNFIFFLQRCREFVWPVAQLYAWCLVPDHFHLVVRIRDEEVLSDYYELADQENGSIHKFLSGKVSKAFSNLFSSYAQAYNKVYERVGSLFMQNMKVEEILNEEALCHLIQYVHFNAVEHGLVKKMEDWPHSSYTMLMQDCPTILSRERVLNVFGGREEFIRFHQQPVDRSYRWLEDKRLGKR